jgi:FAD/FMN-containing dehydrogenase
MAGRSGLAPSHILKVTLENVEPPVWRTFQIPVSASLDDLHAVLQIVMGWESEHLYDFRAGKRRFSPPEEEFGPFPADVPDEEAMKAQVVEGLKQLADLIDHPEERPERQQALSTLLQGISAEPSLLGEMDEDSGLTTVGEVLKRTRSKIIYTYDFGDGWEHTVVVQRSNVPTNPEQPALCLDGAGACPPEDCGGPWGYQRIVAAVENPDDPELADEREWLEGWYENFDPNLFDRDAVNRQLARLVWSLGLEWSESS